ncbi:MAG: hypothetical protein V9E81_06060 [Marmoricola sp.]
MRAIIKPRWGWPYPNLGAVTQTPAYERASLPERIRVRELDPGEPITIAQYSKWKPSPWPASAKCGWNQVPPK